MVYNDDGIKNTDASQHRGVYCPIVTPSSDTYDISRQIRYTRVYYSGGSTASDCVTQGTCPACGLSWTNRDGLTCILVEQNVAVSLKISHRAYVLENGRIVMSGSGASLLHDERVRQAYLGL